MQNNKIRKHKKRSIILLFSLILICIILYKLADRYLIEHVQIGKAFTEVTGPEINSNTSKNSSTVTVAVQVTVTPTASSATPTDSSVTPAVSSATPVASSVPTESPTIDEDVVVSDDWNYTSNSLSIKIKQVSEGSGSDTITYYVADIVAKDSESLKTAFAKNKFGTNIVQDTSIISKDNNAILAINGDYYGFREDGIIIRNGIVFRDVPTRTGLAIYDDGTMKAYDEKSTSAEELVSDGVVQAFSFGPILVENGVAVPEFGKTIIDENFGNRNIENANPRTGIGYIAPNHFVFIIVDGRSSGYSRGATLAEFARIFKESGCTEAYNIDGGGSSTMYFMGRVVNNPLGKGQERGVSDIIYVN